jgi:preprotein translocase subunit SecA
MFEVITRAAKKVFGDANEREIRSLRPLVSRVNELEPAFTAMDHAALLAKTAELREKVARGASLDSVLPEAFANVREAAKRTLGIRHYDCQLIGGMVLHQGKIAEMKTGEGKTLVGTSPVYLNALAGKGVHVVTVNDYLAQRDAEWMGQVYRYLGLSVGVILSGERRDMVKRAAYGSDITYGTNNEFGFDYLRDNMKYSLEEYVQRGHFFAIVDEVDSILIDEARTPLIISGEAEGGVEMYAIIDAVIPLLQVETDFTIDEKAKSVALTDDGVTKIEQKLGVDNLYDVRAQEVLHHVMQSLKAHHLFKRDKDYIVRSGKVVIVDEFRGRPMEGRRWSDGLHQAVEAKEKVRIEKESQVYASITFQNYFRMYEKLGGMTGTAETEAAEFASIYKLDTIVIPTHRSVQRNDRDDIVYKTQMEKFRAVMRDIQECNQRGQPVLVGTTSVEKSEILAELLRRASVPHQVLNAKQHAREAHVVAQAGRLGAVTISTNMAGRGTDIKLGGSPEEMAREEVDPNVDPEGYAAAVERFKVQCTAEAEKVRAAGGLHIIGTERHESRRIDNQLRGRSGRQGDPGSSRFFLSLEDDLLRMFGSDKITVWMERMGLKDDEPIEHRWITRSIENAQKKVEGYHFQMRKNVLEYDDVMNYQRKAIYDLRRRALAGDGILKMVEESRTNVINDMMAECAEEGVHPESWDIASLRERLERIFGVAWEISDVEVRDHSRSELREKIEADTRAKLEALVLECGSIVVAEGEGDGEEFATDASPSADPAETAALGEKAVASFSRGMLLTFTDQLWKDHLLAIDRLRQGVGLRGYGQKNPLLEYKREAFHMFMFMAAMRDESVLQRIYLSAPATMAEAQLNEMGRGMARRLSKAPLARASIDADVEPLLQSTEGFVPLPVAPPAPPAAPEAPAVRPQPGAEARAVAAQFGLRKNDPCPCGSGQKFKRCCGAQGEEDASTNAPSPSDDSSGASELL